MATASLLRVTRRASTTITSGKPPVPPGLFASGKPPVPPGLSASAYRLRLPSENTLYAQPGQGWNIASSIKPSTIPGAGNGRFALELVGAGACVCVKPTVRMATLNSLWHLSADSTIVLESAECLERYINLNRAEGGYRRAQVLEVIEHFVWSLDGERAYLNASTWTMNHAATHAHGLNVEHSIEGFADGTTAVVSRALHEVQPGAELKNNYADFVMPEFYIDFCVAHGFRDVRSAVLAVGS